MWQIGNPHVGAGTDAENSADSGIGKCQFHFIVHLDKMACIVEKTPPFAGNSQTLVDPVEK